MIQAACRVLLLLFLAVGFLVAAKKDFEGQEEKEPGGFEGFIGTCIANMLALALFAGAFGWLRW